jgi:hypothetical protein
VCSIAAWHPILSSHTSPRVAAKEILRKDFIAEMILKKDIEVFSMLMTKIIIETLDAKRSYDVHEEAAREAEELRITHSAGWITPRPAG